ncbi:hypothetical protein GCK32_019477 [Trichostrongylus colubriformis]|uniref:Uncharacterized protein n=1 Tax=Trichostrongylus colubriformis TaxID=6319 RepID=A0AAN8G221_TRICO
MINVPNGLDILAELLENSHITSTICQANIVISQKSPEDAWLLASLLSKSLEATSFLPVSSHTSPGKYCRLLLVNTSPRCTKLYSFIDPVVIE